MSRCQTCQSALHAKCCSRTNQDKRLLQAMPSRGPAKRCYPNTRRPISLGATGELHSPPGRNKAASLYKAVVLLWHSTPPRHAEEPLPHAINTSQTSHTVGFARLGRNFSSDRLSSSSDELSASVTTFNFSRITCFLKLCT